MWKRRWRGMMYCIRQPHLPSSRHSPARRQPWSRPPLAAPCRSIAPSASSLASPILSRERRRYPHRHVDLHSCSRSISRRRGTRSTTDVSLRPEDALWCDRGLYLGLLTRSRLKHGETRTARGRRWRLCRRRLEGVSWWVRGVLTVSQSRYSMSSFSYSLQGASYKGVHYTVYTRYIRL